MTHPYLSALLGGVLIGLASTLLYAFNGRIAGVTGIANGLLFPSRGDWLWRGCFVAGMVGTGAVVFHFAPALLSVELSRSTAALFGGGLLAGFGARLGNGCTSGHGVCGVARLAPRSLVATAVFMLTGALTVFCVNHFWGGAL